VCKMGPSLPLSLSLFHFIVGYDKNFHGLFSNKSRLHTHVHTPPLCWVPIKNSLWQKSNISSVWIANAFGTSSYFLPLS
jgi:hypothetical protein